MPLTWGYIPGKDVVRNLDVRFKFACMAMIALTSVVSSLTGLLLFFLLTLLIIIHMRLSLQSVIREIRYVLPLFFLVFIARLLSTPGEEMFHIVGVSFSLQGIQDGLMVFLRLVLVVILGLIFIVSTRSTDIRNAIQWMFKPVPFVPEQRVATMLSLLIRFIPLLIFHAQELAMIQRARGVENRKHPVYRLKLFAIPFIRRIFDTADKLTVAMEARGYSENRVIPVFKSSKLDWFTFCGVALLCVFSIDMPSFLYDTFDFN